VTPDLDLIKQVEQECRSAGVQECRTATSSDFAAVAVDGAAVGARGTAVLVAENVAAVVGALALNACYPTARRRRHCHVGGAR
jgi:hypothetical protein